MLRPARRLATPPHSPAHLARSQAPCRVRPLAAMWALLGVTTSAWATPSLRLEEPGGAELRHTRVVGFGSNADGQTSVPSDLTGVIAIEAGGANSIALQVDGRVRVWGPLSSAVPVPAGLADVKAVSINGIHAQVLKVDGSTVGWGIGASAAGQTFTQVSAGLGWSVGLRSNGTALTWGQNLPQVPGELMNLTQVSAGDFHVLALRSDFSVTAFGNNSNGQSTIPTDLNCPIAIAAGKRFSLALSCNGTVRSWGHVDNGGGQPVSVPAGLTNVNLIAAGGHALALRADGTVLGWGRNAEGQLNLPAGTGPVRAIAAGDYHSLALTGSRFGYPLGVTVHGPGDLRTFTLRNTGSSALQISGIDTFGVHASEFQVESTGMASSIPAGGQTQFGLRFKPGAAGVRSAMLRVYSNDSSKPRHEVLVQGSGTVFPVLQVRGNGVPIAHGDISPDLADHTDFGEFLPGASGQRSFALHNIGSAPLSINHIELTSSPGADFSFPGPLPSVIAPGASATVHINFTAGGPGVRTGFLIFHSNAANQAGYEIRLKALVLDPEIDISSEGLSIASGSSTPVDFGDVDTAAPHTRTFIVHNRGDNVLSIGAIGFTGPHAQDYSVSMAPPPSIAAGAHAQFQIRFAPGGIGERLAQISIANTDADENPYTFALRGNAYRAALAVSGNGVNITNGDSTPSVIDHSDFGPVLAGSGEVVRRYTFRNEGAGSVPLGLGALTLQGTHAATFSIRSVLPATLAPGASAVVDIGFAPTVIGVHTATLRLVNTDVTQNPFQFAIQGSSVAPEIAIELAGTPLRAASVHAWGANDLGQSSVPAGLVGVTALSAGFGNVVALKQDGTVVAWGRNDFGQSTVPAGLRNVVAISAGRWHTLALKADGTLAAWGLNDHGQSTVTGIGGIIAIAAGDAESFAVRSDGSVLAWGANFFGQLNVPASAQNVVQIAAGYGHTLALRSDGTVVAWGRNPDGQTHVPAGLTGVVAVSAGFHYSMARKQDGSVVVWGENDHGEYDGALGLSGIVESSAATHHGLARTADGILHTWGWNSDGQARVPEHIRPLGQAPVRAMAGGERHSAVVTLPVVEFAASETGLAGRKTLTLRNTGADPLILSSVSLSGPNSADFMLDTTGMLTTLAPGAQTELRLTFLTSAIVPSRALLRVLSNDADEGVFEIAVVGQTAVELAVSGNGIDIANGATLPSLDNHTDFGQQRVGVPQVRTYTLHNHGPGLLELRDFALDHEAFSFAAPPPTSIPPHGSVPLQVRFLAHQAGDFSTELNFRNNDLDENPFRFRLRAHAREAMVGDLDGLDAGLGEGEVLATVVLPNEQILIGGSFTHLQGQTRQRLARLHSDAELDTHFGAGFDGPVHSLAVQPDGKILVGGDFTAYTPVVGEPVARQHLARLHPDGTLDTDFDPAPSDTVYAMALQADGSVLLGGRFTQLHPAGQAGPIARPYLARVQADGQVDLSFHPAPDGVVRSLALQADQRIVLGGEFTHLAINGSAPVSRLRVARLLTDGSLDMDFDPRANATVHQLALQADGRVLLGGAFTALTPGGGNAVARSHLARLTPEGQVDVDFAPAPNGPVFSLAVQTDGRILVGGSFDTFAAAGATPQLSRRNLAMLTAQGGVTALDPAVLSSAGPARVHTLAVQRSGQVLVGGHFDAVQTNGLAQPTARRAFASLINDSAEESWTVPSTGVVEWQRTGAGPELAWVQMELSVDSGANWLAVGSAQRVGTGTRWRWELPVLATHLRLRARAMAPAGSGSSLIESNAWIYDQPAPWMIVQGNGWAIPNGAEPVLINHTQFGAVPVLDATLERSYRIFNTGNATLHVRDLQLTGAQAADFSVITAPASTVAPGSFTTLVVRFDPSALGPRRATVRFGTNVALAHPFRFEIEGSGVNLAPTQILLIPASVAENLPAPTLIGRLSALDPDSTAHSYTLQSGDGDTDNARFSIAGDELRLWVSADFETQSSYSLRVLADDGSGGVIAQPLTVLIGNVNEMPSFVAGANQSIAATTAAQVVPGWASAIDDGDSTVSQALSFNVVVKTGASTLFTVLPTVDADGTLRYTPSGSTGSALIEVSLTDDDSIEGSPALTTATQTFSLSVGTGSSADLSIQKSNGLGFVNGGAPVDYLITVHNAGPAAVLGAQVLDPIGPGTDFDAAQWHCTPLQNGRCPVPASGNGALDARIDLPVGAAVQFLFSATPRPAVETPILNTATVNAPAGMQDPNLGNNQATDGPDQRGVFRNGFE